MVKMMSGMGVLDRGRKVMSRGERERIEGR
jgi:hypothetical protein